jgi:ribonuclease D
MPDWIYIDDPEILAREAVELARAPVIGIDTESDSFYHYRERVCLIQVTGDGPDLIIDPLALDDLSVLAPLMADPEVVKVFHGADYDISSLKRDFGWEIVSVFDTMLASQALGFEKISLADLVDKYFGTRLDKKYQRYDWSRRPLKDECLEYARLDSHYLGRLREILVAEVEAGGRAAQVAEECRLVETREWNHHEYAPDDFMRVRGVGKLDEGARRIMRELCVMRDRMAQRVDRPHFKVIGNDALLQIARHAPESHRALTALLGRKNHVVRRYSADVVEAVRKGLEDRTPLPRSRPDAKVGPRRLTGHVEPKIFEQLRRWRNAAAEERGVAPGTLMPNATLQEIAIVKPDSDEAMERVPDMRDWQRDEFGEAILEIVQKIVV